MENETPHKRRPRYAGTHPRRFEEKYKELDPEKYSADVAHIMERGRTPAGTHRPIMVAEILEFLDIQPGQVGLDATLGYGGHSRKMLEKLGPDGHLYATDVDGAELAKTRARLARLGYGPERFTAYNLNFAQADTIAPPGGFDFVLADLGVSSMQIDDPARGFSFKADGPLDLRLDQSRGETGAQRLRQLSRAELEDLLVENADEPYADKIAKEITARLRRGGIDTTGQLAGAVAAALSFLPEKERKEGVKKSCQRVFQALRIDVNSEFEVLYEFMDKLPGLLKPGGRAAILTFHSGEDRLVKKAFQHFAREGVYAQAAREVIRPSAKECFQNPRARSTKLRWAIKG